MKIRNSFISNSSSTSFIVVDSKNKLSDKLDLVDGKYYYHIGSFHSTDEEHHEVEEFIKELINKDKDCVIEWFISMDSGYLFTFRIFRRYDLIVWFEYGKYGFNIHHDDSDFDYDDIESFIITILDLDFNKINERKIKLNQLDKKINIMEIYNDIFETFDPFKNYYDKDSFFNEMNNLYE